ncbi:MAG: hypothetical protein JXA66_00120 [Oligoflexia bacterium]|nr:hypothetical protein [Oligoflexia bacterium]
MSVFSGYAVKAKTPEQPKAKIKNLAGKISGDGLIHDLFGQELEREQRKLQKNRTQLKYLEDNLRKSIVTGMVEDEQCIRSGISILRTVNYVYDWADEQLKDLAEKKIRLSHLDDLVRVRYLNSIYSNSYLAIEECRLQKSRSRIADREMSKDVSDAKVEKLKEGIAVPEHYPATIAPFR